MLPLASILGLVFCSLNGGHHDDDDDVDAVFNGILNPDKSSINVKPDCMTGNCTFSGPYSSLAVCSSCFNVTKYIEQTVIDMWTVKNQTFYRYNYTLPNGAYTDDGDGIWINTGEHRCEQHGMVWI